MSRQSYHRRRCDQCGGRTAGNGFARFSHQISKAHIDSLRTMLGSMAPLQSEALALSRLIDSLERDRLNRSNNRKRYAEERQARLRKKWKEEERGLIG